MSGGGRGSCAVEMPKGANMGLGHEFRGRGFGMGRGCGRSSRVFRSFGQGEVSKLTELQVKLDRLQAEVEVLKAKGY